jgi:hypothetical protein
MIDTTEAPLTLTVPEAGKRYFGLSREASYAAAARGDIPTIRIGRRLLRVPVRALEAMLDRASESRADWEGGVSTEAADEYRRQLEAEAAA